MQSNRLHRFRRQSCARAWRTRRASKKLLPTAGAWNALTDDMTAANRAVPGTRRTKTCCMRSGRKFALVSSHLIQCSARLVFVRASPPAARRISSLYRIL